MKDTSSRLGVPPLLDSGQDEPFLLLSSSRERSLIKMKNIRFTLLPPSTDTELFTILKVAHFSLNCQYDYSLRSYGLSG